MTDDADAGVRGVKSGDFWMTSFVNCERPLSIFTKLLGLYPLPPKRHNEILLDLSFHIARF